MIKLYVGLHVKCPLFFFDFDEILIFPAYFLKNTQIPHFIKVRTVVLCRQMTKLTVSFRNFAKVAKNRRLFCHHQRATVTLFATQSIYSRGLKTPTEGNKVFASHVL
jgi:hypothetical protein